jgi:hypothetical protein
MQEMGCKEQEGLAHFAFSMADYTDEADYTGTSYLS